MIGVNIMTLQIDGCSMAMTRIPNMSVDSQVPFDHWILPIGALRKRVDFMTLEFKEFAVMVSYSFYFPSFFFLVSLLFFFITKN